MKTNKKKDDAQQKICANVIMLRQMRCSAVFSVVWIGYDNLAAMKDDKSTLLHIVECAAHIKSTVAHLLGKSRHLDTESFGAMRSDTSFGEEPFDALFQTLRRILPESTLPSLQCCREDI